MNFSNEIARFAALVAPDRRNSQHVVSTQRKER
jgi:hypothetical protein